MVGGPEPGHLPEHAHADVQLTVHAGRRSKVQLVEAGEPHAGHWEAGVQVSVMLLSPDLIEEASDDLAIGTPRLRSQPDTGDRLVAELANAVRGHFTRLHRLYFESIGYTLAGHLVRTYGDAPLRTADGTLLDERQLARVDNYIDGMLDAPVGVRDLAAAAGLSPRRFADAFKRTTGRTPYQRVVQRRIAAAKRLLRTTKLSIAEVALQLGFANQSHFTAVFSRAVGTTPRRWRG